MANFYRNSRQVTLDEFEKAYEVKQQGGDPSEVFASVKDGAAALLDYLLLLENANHDPEKVRQVLRERKPKQFASKYDQAPRQTHVPATGARGQQPLMSARWDARAKQTNRFNGKVQNVNAPNTNQNRNGGGTIKILMSGNVPIGSSGHKIDAGSEKKLVRLPEYFDGAVVQTDVGFAGRLHAQSNDWGYIGREVVERMLGSDYIPREMTGGENFSFVPNRVDVYSDLPRTYPDEVQLGENLAHRVKRVESVKPKVPQRSDKDRDNNQVSSMDLKKNDRDGFKLGRNLSAQLYCALKFRCHQIPQSDRYIEYSLIVTRILEKACAMNINLVHHLPETFNPDLMTEHEHLVFHTWMCEGIDLKREGIDINRLGQATPYHSLTYMVNRNREPVMNEGDNGSVVNQSTMEDAVHPEEETEQTVPKVTGITRQRAVTTIEESLINADLESLNFKTPDPTVSRPNPGAISGGSKNSASSIG